MRRPPGPFRERSIGILSPDEQVDPGRRRPHRPPPVSGVEPPSLSGLAIGVDVGGTGVKAALVDLATAELVSARIRDRTPQPSTPSAVLETIASGRRTTDIGGTLGTREFSEAVAEALEQRLASV